MLSNESFDDFKITFLNRYGTASQRQCRLPCRKDASTPVRSRLTLWLAALASAKGESGEPGICLRARPVR